MKRIEPALKEWFEYNFISHMVQMKPEVSNIVPSNFTNFISHMVQMKLNGGSKMNEMELTFISHMVQMKLINEYIEIEIQ